MRTTRLAPVDRAARLAAAVSAGLLLVACSDDGEPDSVGPPSHELRAGAAVRDVTPAFEPYTDTNGNAVWDDGEPFEDHDNDGELDSLWLGGFAVRQPTGVHDSLEARTVAVSVGGQLFTITAIDALGVSRGRVEAIQQTALSELDPSLGLAPERIIVASTHTHAAPDTIGIFGPDTFEPAWDGAYLDELVVAAAGSIVDAVQSLELASVVIASAEGAQGFVQDLVPPDIIDPHVGIVQLRRDDDSVIATLTSIANHPEAAWSSNTEVSADYPGVLRAALENHYGGTAVALVGALGLMQSPAEIGLPGFERVDALGQLYAEEVIGALDAAEPLPPEQVALRFGYDEIPVPFQNGELFLALQTGVVEGYDGYLYDDGSGTCALSCFDMPAAAVRLGDSLTIVTVAGELSPELVVGGIVSPAGYSGAYGLAPPEPHLNPCLDTSERFLIGLAYAEVGYVYPKKTFDPNTYVDQRHGPGPDVAAPLMIGLCDLLAQVNASR